MAPFNYTIREAVTDELKILKEFEQGVIQYERPFAPNLKKDPISSGASKSHSRASSVPLYL